MVTFKDQLSRRATAGRADLANQCRGRSLSPAEQALSVALSAVLGTGVTDFALVAAELTQRGVQAPSDGSTHWTRDRLEAELTAINDDLDRAYLETGYGA